MKNYALSSWIANFGVVPLFLFSAFLFLPDFDFLLALLVFVTLVRETITYLQSRNSDQFFSRIRYLPPLGVLVKSFLLATLSAPVISVGAASPKENTTIVLSIGEQRELIIKYLDKYSIGSSEIISHKFRKAKGSFLIKAKKLGYTDLIIWRGKKVIKYNIYVLNKYRHVELAGLKNVLEKLPLKVQIEGNLVQITGEIEREEDYQLIKYLDQKIKNHTFFRIQLHSTLRNKLIARIYRTFYKHQIQDVSCDCQYLKFQCFYSSHEELPKKTIQYLEKHFHLQLVYHPSLLQTQNFMAQLKIIRLRTTDGSDIGLGLHQVLSNAKQSFRNSFLMLLQNNKQALREQNIEVFDLATPQVVLALNKDAFLQVSNIPTSEDNSSSFAPRLTLKLKLTQMGSQLQMAYETKLQIQIATIAKGSIQSSTLNINLKRQYPLFQIGLASKGNKNTRLPILGNIPVLGNLFSYNSDFKASSLVLGFLLVEKHDF